MINWNATKDVDSCKMVEIMPNITKETLKRKFEEVERLLGSFIRELSESEIHQRCKRITSIDNPNLEQYFLDDQLLFEVEFVLGEIGESSRWEFRIGNEIS